MYGLILENLSEFIKQTYGEEKWEEIRRASSVDQPSFSTHQVYPEALIPKLAKKAMQILEVSENEFFDQMGVFFIGFVSQYGYDRVLSVLGRHMRDFLNGLDNLHEYLKFSYPRMRAPSFICENETRQGLTLHYRSKRRGFVYYTMGQIREVARHFYQKEMKIELIREEVLFDMIHVTFQCTFDNRAFTMASLVMTREEKHLPISASALFEIFPFCIVFGSDMTVRSIGNSLMVILPDVIGKKITTWFDLVRPLIEFKFQTILNRTNNIFELVSVEPVLNDKSGHEKNRLDVILNDEELPEDRNLRLKGQMIYMDNWKMMMYLGTPVMPDLNSLINSGLYINDLSMHDFSRDLMLAGTQQSVELKLALDQEQQKSKKLEESMRKLDEEMRRTDELLYQMIPKQVAVRLRTGENPIDTCEMFDSVSILFSDVVTFTEICSRITPMEVVSMLNGMYSIFDNLTERNNVYKVETIGDAYMVVSGAPEKQGNHAERVCDMALDMVDAIMNLKDPSTDQHLQIRVGVHSGAVVAGIVGLKMPRYCLFGDSVNTASRMESTSSAMQIHISQSTKELLPESYSVLERGEINVKGKGSMKTYWLNGKDSRKPLPQTTTSTNTTTASSKSPCDVIKLGERDVTSSRSPSTISITADRNTIARLSAEGIKQVYSPITFQDVARRSIVSSPVTSPGKESRSNSTPAQGVSVSTTSPRDPSSIFGCPICSPDEDSSSSGDDYRLPAASLLKTLPPPHSSSSTDSLSRPISPRYQKTTVATPLAIHHVIVDSDSVSQSRKDKVSQKSRVNNVSVGRGEVRGDIVSLGKNEIKVDSRNKVNPGSIVNVGDRNTSKEATTNKNIIGSKGKILANEKTAVISSNNKKGNTVPKSRDYTDNVTHCGHTDTVTNPNPTKTHTNDNKLATTTTDGASVNLLPVTTANSTDDMDLLGLGFPACAAMFSGVARAAAAHKKHKHGRHHTKAPLRHAEGCTLAQQQEQASDCTDGGVVQQQLQAHYAAGFRGNVNTAGDQLPPCCIATKNRFHTSACHLM